MTLYLAQNRRGGYWITLGVFSTLDAAQAACRRDAAEDRLGAITWELDDFSGRQWTSRRRNDFIVWDVSSWELDAGRAGWPTIEGDQ